MTVKTCFSSVKGYFDKLYHWQYQHQACRVGLSGNRSSCIFVLPLEFKSSVSCFHFFLWALLRQGRVKNVKSKNRNRAHCGSIQCRPCRELRSAPWSVHRCMYRVEWPVQRAVEVHSGVEVHVHGGVELHSGMEVHVHSGGAR